MSDKSESTERMVKRLPKGTYSMVSVDVDTTGRRLIDEIVQLCAYTPNEQFGHYVMPIMNLNPAARQRHQIRVITVGFFRMLKSMHTYKVLKTKAEILVLKEFLSWLEKCNADTPHSLGTILIYNEQRKFVPFMILEAMGKYGLLPRFFSTVKGFADGYAMAEAQLVDAAKYFSLKQLSKAVMHDGEAAEADSDADAEAAKATADKERDDFEGDAAVRVRLAYQIVERIAAKPKVAGNADDGHADHDYAAAAVSDAKSSDDADGKLQKLVWSFATPMNEHVVALNDQTKCMERQNSLRPIFVNYFKVTLYHRVRAVTFRRVLAEHGYDLDMLHEIWEAKQVDGLRDSMASMDELKAEDKDELLELLDCHFDPEKQAILPVVHKQKSKRGGGNGNNAKENAKPNNGNGGNGGNGGGRKPTSPDSMSKTPTKRSRRRRGSPRKQRHAEHKHNNGECDSAAAATSEATAATSEATHVSDLEHSTIGSKLEALTMAVGGIEIHAN